MKEKIKRFAKQYLIGFVIGIVVCGTVSVIAVTYFPSNEVTYDNTASGMQAINVQGAIDELYNTCFPQKSAGEQIIEDSGLEKDEYECRYFFTGANPNNYITFNDEIWRIISAECDGTIKIMKTSGVGNMMWSSGSADWTMPISLKTYLNGTYYNELNDVSHNQIVSHNFSVGVVTDGNNNIASQVTSENSKIWNGKVALPTLSEYIRTNSNASCKTFSNYIDNYNTCKNTSWMYINNDWWTLSADSTYFDSGYVYYILESGELNFRYANSSYMIRPALYLSSSIKITGGDGSQSNPYTIE